MDRPHHWRVGQALVLVLSELRGYGMADVCIVCCDETNQPARRRRRGLAAGDRADVSGAPDPRLAAICLSQVLGPLARDLRVIYTVAELEAFAPCWRPLSGNRGAVAGALTGVHAVPGVLA